MPAGDTRCEPDPATAPTPWSIEADVAPVTFHWSIEDCPGAMLDGFDVKLTISGGPPAAVATVTVVEAVTEPDAFVAVTV